MSSKSYQKYVFLMLMLFGTSSVFAVINTNGQKGVVRTLSAKTSGKATMNIGFGVNYAQSSDYVDGLVTNGVVGDIIPPSGLPFSSIRESAKLLSSNAFLNFGILSSWDVSFSAPYYYDWSGFSTVHSGGVGDIEIATKITYPPPSRRLYYQSYYLSGTIPVGMKNVGLFPRHPYFIADKDTNPAEEFFSSAYPTIKGLMLWTFDIGAVRPKFPFQININIGGVITATTEKQNNTAIGSLSFEYTPQDFVTIFVDLHGESRWNNFATALDPTNDPMYATPGIRITTPTGMYLVLAGDLSLSSKAASVRRNWIREGYSYSTGVIPAYGAQFAIGWNGYLTAQDDDMDGITNDEDRCPKDPEDIDGYQDSDGCPDPDNDADGIPDLRDKCPLEPEDKDGFKDDDGCPDGDNDGDGIIDIKDMCPNVAEDFDGYEDPDGCPDPDNDKDGVPDVSDKCPNNVEDFDEFQDNDGCPDIDNDKDGIPDLKDRCPNEPETFNSFEDKDGCPDSVKKEPEFPRQQLLRGVSFRTGTAEMTFDSQQFLEPVVKSMKAYPELEIEIRAHTEAMGEFSANMRLSQMRAEAVRQYLISRDINADRIRATGAGSTMPIADNKSAAGRIQNRRIEILRIR